MLDLPVVPTPFEDEDLLGFLARCANSNALTVAELVKAFRSTSQTGMRTWVREVEHPLIWDNQFDELLHPSTRPARAWSHRNRKFCPHCMIEAGYWRASWCLMLATCCPRHSIWLQERCCSCGTTLSIEAMRCFRCDVCGKLLVDADSAVQPAGREALWIAQQLTLRVARSSERSDHITDDLTLSEFHELALRVGVRGSIVNTNKPLKLKEAGALTVAIPIAEGAGKALMNWPYGFEDMLGAIREQRRNASSWKIREAMGPIYWDIYHDLKDPRFDFVRTAFESYIRDHWEAPLACRNRNIGLPLVRNHTWVPVCEAAKRSGVEPALLKRMAKGREIPTREQTRKSGRCARIVNLATVRNYAGRVQQMMTAEQTAAHLGISRKRVRQLLEAGLLTVLGGTPRAGQRWWIDPISLDRCTHSGRQMATEPKDSVSVTQLAKYSIANAEGFVSLIGAIQSGELSVWVPPGSKQEMGKWRLSEDDFVKWRPVAETVGASKLSVSDVAVQLGVKPEVAYALVRARLLPATTDSAGRRVAQWVDIRALSEFRERYILGTELAALARTSPKQVAQRLKACGIQPIAGPDSARTSCRQYVWQRTPGVLSAAVAET
ncbi:helix-turn-helix domain-containing protein [Cupriavidus necator]